MDQERYDLMDVIGSGGMATVWRARDTKLGRIVALKRPHPAAPGSETLARFAREARAAATVSHPHLVAVYDTGEDERGPYLVMEFVDGPSLAAAPRSAEAAALGAGVASALDALHRAGIVHGDVKPGNILLGPGGAKLTDFGIARTVDDTSTLTQAGVALGTPAYAAPETIATGARTAAADVYSLAALLHEVVIGTRWNPAAGSTQAMPAPAWSAVLAPALATDPAQRPTSGAFAAQLSDLERLGDPHTATVAMSTRPVGAEPLGDDPLAAEPEDASPANETAANRAPASVMLPRPAVETPRRTSPAGVVAIVVAVVALGVLGILAVLASRSDDGVLSSAVDTTASVAVDQAVVATTAAAPSTTAVPTTVAPTTVAPTTVPPTTVAPTTLPPTTLPPTTAPPPPSSADLAAELTALIEDATPDELKPKESREVVKRIDEAMRAAENDDFDETRRKLAEAADRIDQHVCSDSTWARATELLEALASSLGVDPDSIADPG